MIIRRQRPTDIKLATKYDSPELMTKRSKYEFFFVAYLGRTGSPHSYRVLSPINQPLEVEIAEDTLIKVNLNALRDLKMDPFTAQVYNLPTQEWFHFSLADFMGPEDVDNVLCSLIDAADELGCDLFGSHKLGVLMVSNPIGTIWEVPLLRAIIEAGASSNYIGALKKIMR